jgi:3-deoxy-D-manno-octulosonate 8-phosphate phosphatase (KDO 8-P phosphatase)
LSACPASAFDEVKAAAQYVCERRGGDGCVREVIDRVLLGEGCAAAELATTDGVASNAG